MEKAADLLRCGAHLFPPVRPPGWQYRAVLALARSNVPASNDSDKARAALTASPGPLAPTWGPGLIRCRPGQSRARRMPRGRSWVPALAARGRAPGRTGADRLLP